MVRTTASGISGPADLAGKTVGELGIYGQDSGVSAKGILMDEYGFKPEQCRWVIGGLDRPLDPCDFVPRPHPADVEVTVAPDGKALGPMRGDRDVPAVSRRAGPVRAAVDGAGSLRAGPARHGT
jgi:4,5-dihydroxyphthalate decarboxylase